MIRYPITIFLSAFLLFQVQPLIGKVILPWFGGSPAVWTACMLFFQVLLLGGYSYAHFVSGKLPPKVLAAMHAGLLALSLWFLPVTPDAAWKPAGDEIPVLRILGLLVFTIGLPYFLLSTTGPLLQESFHRETGRTPYRLYALSNAGSLLALLTYPFVFEPRFALHTQVVSWSIGYGLFVALCLWSALAFGRVWRTSAANEPSAIEAGGPRPAARDIVLWLALAACGSVMLLATTNQLCQEVTSVPFLWVLPLSLYLLTFIICFDHERWYHRGTFAVLLAAGVLVAIFALTEGNRLPIWWQLAIYSGALFACCMVCHGELALAKPAPRYVTLFYLMVAAGGALGGVLVAIVAPLVLPGYYEYHLGLFATVALALAASLSRPGAKLGIPRPAWIVGGTVAVVASLAMGLVMGRGGGTPWEQTLETSRNFYGVLRVSRQVNPHADHGPWLALMHGSIQHGTQYLDPHKRHQPTTYYGPTSGVGLAIERHPRRLAQAADDGTPDPLRIGVVGLGSGTLAAYGGPEDYLRFYEINPEVIRLSGKYFTYLRDTPAEVDVILGDARVQLERELADGHPQQFDVLAVDAFSSDAIPMHLLTTEAVELFLKHLKPDGILCMHISNKFLDLSGVLLGIAQALHLPCVLIDSQPDESLGLNAATWIVLTKNFEFLNDANVSEVSRPSWPERGGPLVWTDDYGSVWQTVSE